MNKSQMSNMIFFELSGVLVPLGFKAQKKNSVFIRPFDGGYHQISFPLYNYNPEYTFGLNICVRMDASVDIFNLIYGITDKDRSSLTTITTLKQYPGGVSELNVSTEQDVHKAVARLAPIITGQILPILDKCDTLAGLNALVNHGTASFDISQNPSGAMNSIILSKLAGDPEFECIVEKHRAAMGLDASEDHVFNKLVLYLQDGLKGT